MEIFITYVIPVLELIMSIIGTFFLFKPAESSNHIEVGDKYYFSQSIHEGRNNDSTSQSEYGAIFLVLIILFATYLFYSLVGELMIFIIMAVSLMKVIRYRSLGIDYRRELITPIFSIWAFYLLNFLPTNIKQFWENNTKLDFSKFNSLKGTIEAILEPIPEFFELFTNFEENKTRNISIFSIVLMTLFVTFFEGSSLFQKKQNIRIKSISFVVLHCVILFILLGFVFYHIEYNPVRIVTELIINWFNN